MGCAVLVHAKARLLVSTGTPIAPHSVDGLDGLDVVSRRVRIPAALHDDAGLRHDAHTVEGFCRQFDCDPEPQRDVLYTMSTFAVRL